MYYPGDQLQQFSSSFLRTVVILLFFVDQHPGETGDGVAISCFRIGEGYFRIRRNGDIRSGCYAGDAGGNEITGFVLNFGIGHGILDGISQLDVPDSARSLFDQAGNTFVPFSTQAYAPVDGRTFPYFGAPFFAYFGKISREDIRGTATIGTVSDHDSRSGKLGGFVDGGDLGIGPFGDLSQKDIAQHSRAQLRVILSFRQVLPQYPTASHNSNLQTLSRS